MPTFRFCEICKEYFEEELEIHQINCTSTSIDVSECVETKHLSNSELAQSLDQQPVEKEGICEFCSGIFSTAEELSIHREVCKHEEIKCEKCSVRVKRRNRTKHMNKHSMKVYIKKCYYCDKEVEEKGLESHSSTCDVSLVRCEKCQIRIARRYMAYHLSVDCVKRMIQCEYCNSDMVADTLQEHFEVCTLIPVYCENKCGQEMKRNELQQHLHEECPRRVVECQYCANNLEFELLETHYSECEKFPVACPKVCGQSVPRDGIEIHLDEACEKSYAKCMYQAVSCTFEGFPVNIRKHIQDDNVFHAEITNNKIGDVLMIVENQEGIITTLEGKLKKTEDTLEETVKTLKETEETLQRKLKKTEERVNELEESLKKMKGINTPKFLTSGRFLWRIEDIPENLKSFKFNEALYSDTFYDSEYGYNLQVCLYPNGQNLGNGNVNRDCVAIYIRICPGKYDSILDWPFRKRVTLTLIDQKDRANDVAKCIKDFGDSKGSQKPDCNTPIFGRGFSPFVTHNEVRRGKYVCDNVLFIEVKIESIDV